MRLKIRCDEKFCKFLEFWVNMAPDRRRIACSVLPAGRISIDLHHHRAYFRLFLPPDASRTFAARCEYICARMICIFFCFVYIRKNTQRKRGD
jgi:hypothetical protein